MTKNIRRNGINYRLKKEADGWISIYEINAGMPPTPLIQACDYEKAETYCTMREKFNMPLIRIA